jgi:hypothetical protein
VTAESRAAPTDASDLPYGLGFADDGENVFGSKGEARGETLVFEKGKDGRGRREDVGL